MKNYRTLDAIVVIVALCEVWFILWALVFRTIPQAQLPIIAGLAGTLFGGTVGLYAGARWGNKKTDEAPASGSGGDVSLSLSATSTASPPIDEPVK